MAGFFATIIDDFFRDSEYKDLVKRINFLEEQERYLEEAELCLKIVDNQKDRGNIIGDFIITAVFCYIKAQDLYKAIDYVYFIDESYHSIMSQVTIYRCCLPACLAQIHLVLSCLGNNREDHIAKVFWYCEEFFKIENNEGVYTYYVNGKAFCGDEHKKLVEETNYYIGLAYQCYSFKFYHKDYSKHVNYNIKAVGYFNKSEKITRVASAKILSLSLIMISYTLAGDFKKADELNQEINCFFKENDEKELFNDDESCFTTYYILYVNALSNFINRNYDFDDYVSDSMRIFRYEEYDSLKVIQLIKNWKLKNFKEVNIALESSDKTQLLKELKPYTNNGIVDKDLLDYISGNAQIKSTLDLLVGMDNIKEKVSEIVSYAKTQKMRKDMGINSTPLSLHMLFYGPPGTGKTTVARAIAQEYASMGILSKGHLVETDRQGLVAGYVGQTAIKTGKVIDNAIGGILFIDEAYSLIRGNEEDFGREALDTLVKAMEDNRENLVVIMAGYPDEMDSLISANPGLESRFPFKLKFENYDQNQLYKIALGMFSERNYQLSEAAKQAIEQSLSEFSGVDGGGRLVRNFVESIILKQSLRVSLLNSPTKNDLVMILDIDINPDKEQSHESITVNSNSLKDGQINEMLIVECKECNGIFKVPKYLGHINSKCPYCGHKP